MLFEAYLLDVRPASRDQSVSIGLLRYQNPAWPRIMAAEPTLEQTLWQHAVIEQVFFDWKGLGNARQATNAVCVALCSCAEQEFALIIQLLNFCAEPQRPRVCTFLWALFPCSLMLMTCRQQSWLPPVTASPD